MAAKRKPVQVSPEVHSKLESLLCKSASGWSTSMSDVIDYLIQFHKNYHSPEMAAALQATKIIEERLLKDQEEFKKLVATKLQGIG